MAKRKKAKLQAAKEPSRREFTMKGALGVIVTTATVLSGLKDTRDLVSDLIPARPLPITGNANLHQDPNKVNATGIASGRATVRGRGAQL